MTGALELGGDPPCWAHLIEAPRRDLCDTADIEQLVRAFYRRAATDNRLAPVFEAATGRLVGPHSGARRLLVVAAARDPWL